MSGIASIKAVRDIMQRHNLYTRKGYGQNFLIDQNIVCKIADSANLSKADYVVEIGPGLGTLTRELAMRSRGVLAVDIDTRLEGVLAETLADFTNTALLFQDILKTDIEAELMRAFQLKEMAEYKVCANIPYNITTPIIFRLLENCPHMQTATLMMQKEVGNRILASPGSKEYGRLTAAVAYHARVVSLLNVSQNCFYPRPEVDSIVLGFIPRINRELKNTEEKIFKEFLNSAFQQRRKTILNICAGFFAITKSETEIIIRELGLETNLRPENLGLEDYIALIKAFSS